MNDEHDTLAAQAVLQEFEFRSQPGLISWLRAIWHSMAGKWADRYIVQQQTKFNLAVVDEIFAVVDEINDLGDQFVLSDHDLADLTRTVAELSQQVIQLHRAVTALQSAEVRTRQE